MARKKFNVNSRIFEFSRPDEKKRLPSSLSEIIMTCTSALVTSAHKSVQKFAFRNLLMHNKNKLLL